MALSYCVENRLSIQRVTPLNRSGINLRQMLDKTCSECNRLWAEYSEVIQKTFRLEERRSSAKLRQDNEQMKALTGRLASLAESQTRLGQALTEHVGQAHATR